MSPFSTHKIKKKVFCSLKNGNNKVAILEGLWVFGTAVLYRRRVKSNSLAPGDLTFPKVEYRASDEKVMVQIKVTKITATILNLS